MFLPAQLAAAKALQLPKSWYDEVNAIYRKRREKVFELLDLLQCVYDKKQAGMFVWADASCDTTVLTEKAMNQGYLFAPGSLFSPNQLPSTKTRINVATMSDPGVWRFLEGELGKA